MTKEKMIAKLEEYLKSIENLKEGLEHDSKVYKFYEGMEKMVKEEIEEANIFTVTHKTMERFKLKLHDYMEKEIKGK